jgi:hypothetical protein
LGFFFHFQKKNSSISILLSFLRFFRIRWESLLRNNFHLLLCFYHRFIETQELHVCAVLSFFCAWYMSHTSVEPWNFKKEDWATPWTLNQLILKDQHMASCKSHIKIYFDALCTTFFDFVHKTKQQSVA